MSPEGSDKKTRDQSLADLMGDKDKPKPKGDAGGDALAEALGAGSASDDADGTAAGEETVEDAAEADAADVDGGEATAPGGDEAPGEGATTPVRDAGPDPDDAASGGEGGRAPQDAGHAEASDAGTRGGQADEARDDAGQGRSERRQGYGIKETTELPGGIRLKDRPGGESPAGERVATAVKRPKAPAPGAPAPPRTGAPLEDEGFLRRARKREDKAARQQARDEARRMREDARTMLHEARKREKAQLALEAHMEKVAVAGSDLGYDPERPITRIPDLPAHMEEVSFRTIKEDRAFIRMAFDTEQNNYLYEVIEPVLTPNEDKIKAFLRDTLIRTLDGRRARQVDWAEYLREAVQQAIVDHDILVDHVSTERILYFLIRDFLGYGPIDVLMHDDQLEDISCDGPEIPIYVFHRQHESIRTNIRFEEDLEIDSFVIRLAQRSGKHISIADPLLDATLPDGSRLQATLSREVTSRGSSFTIRKFREEPFTPPDLIDYGTVTTPMCAYFWFMMEEGRSLVYAGGTASGKTTTLNATCQFIPPEKKIVSIEDTREINLLHENWIAGVTRSGFGGENLAGKRAGTIDMYRLLEAALRQRPEYLLVGEVRGPEALTLFQAMATGHAVYSTMHADSAMSAVYRLENPPINVPRMMLQTLDTICIQAQVKVGDKMSRRVREVVEIIGFDPDTEDLLTNTVFYWDPAADRHVFTGHSSVFDQIQDKKDWSDEEFQLEWERRMLVLEWLRSKSVNHFRDFSGIIHEYYQRPERVMQRIEEDGFSLDQAVAAGSRAGDTSAMYGGEVAEPGHIAPMGRGRGPAGETARDEAPPSAGPDDPDYVPPWKRDGDDSDEAGHGTQ